MKSEEELWITNISHTKDISLGDLRLTIRAGQSINLFAKGKNGRSRFNFTREAVENSVKTGSIFKKNDVIKIRKVAPKLFSHVIPIAELTSRNFTKVKRNPTEIEILDYPDLDLDENIIDEEAFAAENADMDFVDRKPILAVDPKFK